MTSDKVDIVCKLQSKCILKYTKYKFYISQFISSLQIRFQKFRKIDSLQFADILLNIYSFKNTNLYKIKIKVVVVNMLLSLMINIVNSSTKVRFSLPH